MQIRTGRVFDALNKYEKLSVREIRSALTRLDRIVAREGEVLITKRGRPIARLLPVRPQKPMPSHSDVRAQMRPLAVGSEVLVREDRDRR